MNRLPITVWEARIKAAFRLPVPANNKYGVLYQLTLKLRIDNILTIKSMFIRITNFIIAFNDAPFIIAAC